MKTLLGDTPDRKLAEKIHQSWLAFAHYGNPNVSDSPEWKPYNKERRSTMLISTNSKLENEPHEWLV